MITNALVELKKAPSVSVQSVDCRETLCKIEVGTAGETTYQEAFNALLQAQWHFGGGPAFLTRDDMSGTTKGLVMFVGRQGHDLPDAQM
jgi:hypothetical protein